MSTIKEITNPQQWNDFLLGIQPNTFLHSWQWGEFQKADGEKVRYLGIFEDEQQIGACLLLTIEARRGRHMLIPHGPIFKSDAAARTHIPELIGFCRAVAREDKPVCLRIAPLLETTPANQTFFRNLGFRPAPLHVHAELTWVLDISKPEEQLLSEMRKTTRHAIQKASKLGTIVQLFPSVDSRESTDGGGGELRRFAALYQQTKSRHDFVPYSLETLRKQYQIFNKTNLVYMAIASHQGKDIAAGIFFQFGETVFYYHGASIKGSVPAAQLLQWASIKEAKRRGATRYNFWGIAPLGSPEPRRRRRHPFEGITVFKKGFGGYAIDYMHAQDRPLSPMYWKLWLVEQLRKKKRGF